MQNCHPCNIPLDPGTANEFYLENTELLAPDNVKKYQQILGSLIYLSTMTRPDLTFATSLLSRFLAKPRHVHMLGAKHVLRYLKGTTDFLISYFKNSANDFPITYVDASLGGCKNSGHSTTGYISYNSGGPIIWHSGKQTIVTTSTMYSEYIAFYTACTSIMWLKNFNDRIKYGFVTLCTRTFTKENY